MIRAIIIDDEQHCIDRLESLVLEHFRESIAIVGLADSIEMSFELIERLKPNLVFLDIQIHDQTGFELLNMFENPEFDVIFCTAYRQYTLQAIKFGALDYLLKPIHIDDLKETLSRVLEKHEKFREKKLLYEMTRHNLDTAKSRIAIPTSSSNLEIIETKDIIRCKGDVNYTQVFINGGIEHTISKTLKDFEDMLSDRGFIRVHNSHLVNIDYIKKYRPGKGGFLILKDKTEIEVSARRKKTLMKELDKMKL